MTKGINDFVQRFATSLKEETKMSAAVAAMTTLHMYVKESEDGTLSGLLNSLKEIVNEMKVLDTNISTSVTSGCELFIRFITLASLEQKDFSDCKQVLIRRGHAFLDKCSKSRSRIASMSEQFIRDGATILTHSRSRVVLELLKVAMEKKKRFTMFITESLPDQSGCQMQKELQLLGIPSTVILDSAVGYVMERVDMVLVGAEAIVESGGIINKIGTFQMAVTAKAMNKPVYAVAESFKFLRLYPLTQSDVPNATKYSTSGVLAKEHPSVDYTPPSYIALLFTDLGVLTPSAVSDELIKLYL